jgi:hypothetical protein
MATSIVDIVNRALDYLGQQPLVSFDEPGPNAAKVRRVWPQARDAVLREHTWKSATRRSRLNLLSDRPAFGFAHRYQLPPDFLRLVDTNPPEARVEVEGDTLLADVEELSIAYVARVDNPRLFDATLSDALSLRLAAELAFGVSASVSLAQQLEDRYRQRLKEARGYDAREGATPPARMASWVGAKLGM